MTAQSEIAELMKQAGAVFVRKGKHHIWRLPNGALMTTSCSPSAPWTTVLKQLDAADAGMSAEKENDSEKN